MTQDTSAAIRRCCTYMTSNSAILSYIHAEYDPRVTLAQVARIRRDMGRKGMVGQTTDGRRVVVNASPAKANVRNLGNIHEMAKLPEDSAYFDGMAERRERERASSDALANAVNDLIERRAREVRLPFVVVSAWLNDGPRAAEAVARELAAA